MKPTAKHYDLVRRSLMTEKTVSASESNVVVFEIDIKANKRQIKQAIEAIFNVKVRSVNTLITAAKHVSMRGRQGRRKKMKKAYVRLEEGHMIDVGNIK